jgi:hypothetical protein
MSVGQNIGRPKGRLAKCRSAKMSVGEMSVGQMSVGQNVGRRNVGRRNVFRVKDVEPVASSFFFSVLVFSFLSVLFFVVLCPKL